MRDASDVMSSVFGQLLERRRLYSLGDEWRTHRSGKSFPHQSFGLKPSNKASSTVSTQQSEYFCSKQYHLIATVIIWNQRRIPVLEARRSANRTLAKCQRQRATTPCRLSGKLKRPRQSKRVCPTIVISIQYSILTILYRQGRSSRQAQRKISAQEPGPNSEADR